MNGKSETGWLDELGTGSAEAVDRLVRLLQTELREMAHGRMRNERVGHTLSTTGLVNEVYLRLCKARQLRADDRTGFLAAAGNTMRRILVDHARAKKSHKRGGESTRVPLDLVEPFLADEEVENLLLLDAALEKMERINPEGALIVEHRFFAGLTQEETASLLGVSLKTVQRRWIAARAWLRRELGAAVESESDSPLT